VQERETFYLSYKKIIFESIFVPVKESRKAASQQGVKLPKFLKIKEEEKVFS
jgi:hypothetical protein